MEGCATGDKAAALQSLAIVKGLLQQDTDTSSDPEGNGSLLWLELADTFVMLSQPDDVAHCIEKARQGSGSTAQSFHLQAQLHQVILHAARLQQQIGSDSVLSEIRMQLTKQAPLIRMLMYCSCKERQMLQSAAASLLWQ